MLLTLYDRTGAVKATLSPNDSSTQDTEVQGDNVLSLSFTLCDFVDIDVNDYVDFGGGRYWAVEKYLPQMKSIVEWEYNIRLYGIESLIKRFLVLNMTDGDAEAVFALTARPIDHMRLIVRNINAGMESTDWKVGEVEGTENVVIDYTGKYCDEALRELAEAVGTEWWVEGETVNLCRCERGEELTLGYGNGLTGLDRDMADNAKFYTRLFPIGSSRNIDPSFYGHTRLQLPGGAKFVDVNADKYGIIHHYEADAFQEIYPRYVGRVSSVRSEEVRNQDGEPFTVYYFKDDNLPFDPNDYEIAGLVKHVSFQEGSELAGLGVDDDHYFDVNFNSATREFEIITIWPYDNDMQLPGGVLVPHVGDAYIPWNIRMPDEYYALAEAEFRDAVDTYNERHVSDVSRYKGPTDHVWVEEEASADDFYPGRRVRLEHEEYFPEEGFRSSRITRITRKVNMPSQMDLEISDALSTGTLSKISDSISEAKSYTRAIVGALNVPDVIRSWERTLPTDNNLLSAKRCYQDFLRKTGDDTMAGVLTALGLVAGRVRSADFLTGVRGYELKDEQGVSTLELDHLHVRRELRADKLEIRETAYTSGRQVLSAAGSTLTRVVPLYGAVLGVTAGNAAVTSGDRRVVAMGSVGSTVCGWRCYFKADDGTTATRNWWRAGDLALCRTLNLETNRYYWRAVTAYGADYVDLSATDCDPAAVNDEPVPGDKIVQYGNRTDVSRQNAIVLDTEVPYLLQLTGLNGFVSGDAVTLLSPCNNVLTGTLRVLPGSTYRDAGGQDVDLAGGIVAEALQAERIYAANAIIKNLQLERALVSGFVLKERFDLTPENIGDLVDNTGAVGNLFNAGTSIHVNAGFTQEVRLRLPCVVADGYGPILDGETLAGVTYDADNLPMLAQCRKLDGVTVTVYNESDVDVRLGMYTNGPGATPPGWETVVKPGRSTAVKLVRGSDMMYYGAYNARSASVETFLWELAGGVGAWSCFD